MIPREMQMNSAGGMQKWQAVGGGGLHLSGDIEEAGPPVDGDDVDREQLDEGEQVVVQVLPDLQHLPGRSKGSGSTARSGIWTSRPCWYCMQGHGGARGGIN